MELGMIGMGRMGAPMAQRLLRNGHRVVGFARNADALRRVPRLDVDSGRATIEPSARFSSLAKR